MVQEVKLSDIEGLFSVLNGQRSPSFDYTLEKFITQGIGNTVLGVYSEKKLVAVAIIEDKASHYYIPAFVVSKAEHGRGYGKRLMAGLLESFNDKPVTLQVHPDNITARNLYKSFGFTESDSITHVYPDGKYCINCEKIP
jgi:ribosomal protein S18 acetylase RimI-like enzyme